MEIGVKDPPTVTAAGERVAQLPHGMTTRDIVTHVDDRGSLFEMFDPRWEWLAEPFTYAYCVTIRPGIIKGWALHKRHEDRYMVLFGEMELVLYDARETSPTHGLVATIALSEFQRRLVNIPAGIWHADRNIGNKDVVLVNFPTEPYDHADPDKYRLPLDTDRIPHRFDHPRGY